MKIIYNVWNFIKEFLEMLPDAIYKKDKKVVFIYTSQFSIVFKEMT